MTVHVSGRSISALLLQWDDPVEKHLPEFTLVDGRASLVTS